MAESQDEFGWWSFGGTRQSWAGWGCWDRVQLSLGIPKDGDPRMETPEPFRAPVPVVGNPHD